VRLKNSLKECRPLRGRHSLKKIRVLFGNTQKTRIRSFFTYSFSVVTTTAPACQVIQVHLSGTSYTPSTVNVRIGDSILWVWDSGFHNVASATNNVACIDSGVFRLGDINGNPVSPPFNVTQFIGAPTFSPGTQVPFICDVHCVFGMRGVINVAVDPCPSTSVVTTTAGPTVSTTAPATTTVITTTTTAGPTVSTTAPTTTSGGKQKEKKRFLGPPRLRRGGPRKKNRVVFFLSLFLFGAPGNNGPLLPGGGFKKYSCFC
jgi:plastocyanin